MPQTTAITDVITCLADVETRFHLHQTVNPAFFPEWLEPLPPLSEAETTQLDTLRHRFLYHRQEGTLSEGTVTLLLGSPLLEIAGLYDAPFKMRGEMTVNIVLPDEDPDEPPLRGRIDVLTLQQQLWIVLLESKRTTISALSALPQTLTYMMANPHPQRPTFAMVANGDEIFFVKVQSQLDPTDGRSRLEYDVSDSFSPFPVRNRLYSVVRILKRLGACAIAAD